MCCQGSATSTSTTQVPKEVLDRYTAANNAASAAATTPFQQYSTDPSAFVSPLSATQQAGIQNTNTAAGQAQPYYGAATGTLLNAQSAAAPLYGTAQSDLNSGQSAGLNLYNESNKGAVAAQQSGQGYNNAATGLAEAGTGQVNAQQIGAGQINQFLSPYLGDVMQSTEALQNQSNQQQQAGQLGNAINSGAFGGDRAGIAAANLEQQQNLGNSSTLANIANQGYNTALGAAQQQQGVNLSAGQANRSALQTGAGQLQSIGQQQYAQGLGTAQQQAANAQGEAGLRQNTATGLENVAQGVYGLGSNTANSLAGLGAGAQSAALQGSTAQLAAGQQEQSTNQAGLTSLYNQFLQQQSYPFQTAQFLANVAEGTGSLSGSTTSTTQPTGLFGNLLSDRRAKEDIKKVGTAKNGLPIYSFRYKGDPQKVTHIGFMADEVEKKHPEAVGLAGGLKTVDYARATKADGGALMFDPNGGAYGLANGTPGHGGYVPSSGQAPARQIAFQHTPPAPRQAGLSDLASDYKQAKGLYNDGTSLWNDGKSVATGLGLARGGLALRRDYGGPVDDPYQDDMDMQQRAMDRAPDAAAHGPVSGALTAQQASPKYSLNSPQAPGGKSNSGLGDLASIAKLGADIIPYLAAGGLVRERHADGDSVGDTVNTDEFGRPLGPTPVAAGLKPYGDIPAEKYAPTPPERPKGLVPAPMVSPDDVSKQPAFDGSKLDVPMPPPRPSDLDAPAGGLIPQQKRVPVVPPAARTAIADNGDSSAQANMSTGLGAAAPLNVRNNNIGNIVDGKFAQQMPGYKGADNRGFAVFDTPEAGSAAAEHNLIAYQKMGLTTPSQIISRWSPPNAPGNSPQATANYTGFVAQKLGVSPDTPLDMSDPKVRAAMVGAIGQFEGGARPNPPNQQVALGGNNPQPQQQPQPQQGGGLMDSLSSFFHGHPDGQTSPNGGMGERALMGVLSGLGAVGSYRGQSILGAALQGLGAGAHGYMDAGKTQADIARQQADTGLVGAQTGETAARTGFVGAQTGTQQAATMAARQELIGKSRWVDPYGQMWVHTADDRVMTQDQWDGSGRPTLYGQGQGATSVPAPAPTAPASAGHPAIVPSAPAAPMAPAAPSAGMVTPPTVSKPPAVPFGVNFGANSINTAKNDMNAMKGPNFDALKAQSAPYYKITQDGMQAASDSQPYTQELAKVLNQAYNDPKSAKPGAGFNSRAQIASFGNTLERMYGGKETFGDADTQQEIANKVDTLRATMAARGAGQQALGALETLKAATPNLSQNPKASSALIAQLMADEAKARDRANHAQVYGQLSHGSYFNAANDFNANNGPDKYNFERDQLQKLLLTEKPQVVQNLMSGKYPADTLKKQLQAGGYPPALARYFTTGG